MPGRRGGDLQTGRNCRRLQPFHHNHTLEPRLLLSAGLDAAGIQPTTQVAVLHARTAHREASRARLAPHPLNRTTPTAEINAQYAAFLADFVQVEDAYVQSIVNGQTSTTTVTATLTEPYTF